MGMQSVLCRGVYRSVQQAVLGGWWEHALLPSHSGFSGSKLIAKSWDTYENSKGIIPSCLTLPPAPPFSWHPAYLEVGRDSSPKAKCWEPLITGEKKRL